MSQIMKGFLGVFLLLMLSVTSTEILRGYLQVLYAQDMHSQVICEVEDSYYNAAVIESCLNRAKESGYSLDISLYDKAGNNYLFTTGGNNSSYEALSKADIKGGEVQLGFHYSFQFYGMDHEQFLRGYVM